jgi:hypothetical protein
MRRAMARVAGRCSIINNVDTLEVGSAQQKLITITFKRQFL